MIETLAVLFAIGSGVWAAYDPSSFTTAVGAGIVTLIVAGIIIHQQIRSDAFGSAKLK